MLSRKVVYSPRTIDGEADCHVRKTGSSLVRTWGSRRSTTPTGGRLRTEGPAPLPPGFRNFYVARPCRSSAAPADKRMIALLRRALAQRRAFRVLAGVVGQVWRDGRVQVASALCGTALRINRRLGNPLPAFRGRYFSGGEYSYVLRPVLVNRPA